MKLYEKITLILLCAINFTYLFPGLLPDTMILVGNGVYIKVKDLKIGDHIPIYKLPEHQLDVQEIVRIAKHKTKELISIEADKNKIFIGENQKLFNRKIKKFIPAKDFSIEDMLFSPEKGNLTITNVEKIKLEDAIELYDISIKGNLFLILLDKEIHLLVHDKAVPVKIFDDKIISLLIESFFKIVAIAGFIIISEKLLPDEKQNQTADKKVGNNSKPNITNSLDTTNTCSAKATQPKFDRCRSSHDKISTTVP
jgi:hypothetical protein